MSIPHSSATDKVTLLTLQEKKRRREPVTMLTAYDYPSAQALDAGGVDVILVGDSLGVVVLGYENTLSVTLEDMLHHCKAVARGARRAHLVGDMPFLSYQVSTAEAVRNAGRLLQEGGMNGVKLEGGREVAVAVEAITSAGIPVMGHLGLTPQSVHKLGGCKVQGRSAGSALRLLEDARILEHAGCHAIVLEAVPERVAQLVTDRLKIPTIGIGAGAHCDGQVLVTSDLVGLFNDFTPRFVKRYAELQTEWTRAVRAYVADVAARRFPAPEHAYAINQAELDSLLEVLDEGAVPARS